MRIATTLQVQGVIVVTIVVNVGVSLLSLRRGTRILQTVGAYDNFAKTVAIFSIVVQCLRLGIGAMTLIIIDAHWVQNSSENA